MNIFIKGKMNFHEIWINLKIKINDNNIKFILFQNFDKINLEENIIKDSREIIKFNINQEYYKEIIQIIYNQSIINYFENSIYYFKEKIEDLREYS